MIDEKRLKDLLHELIVEVKDSKGNYNTIRVEYLENKLDKTFKNGRTD